MVDKQGLLHVEELTSSKQLAIYVQVSNGKKVMKVKAPVVGVKVVVPPTKIRSQPPQFDGPIQVSPIDFYNITSDFLVIKLPKITKHNESQGVSLEISPLAKYLTYQNSTNSIVIDMTKVAKSNFGLNWFQIKLKDDEGSMSSYALPIEFRRNETIFQSEKHLNSLDNEDKNQKPISARIKQVTSQGVVEIVFSEALKTDGLNLTILNTSSFDIYIVPY